MDERQHVPLSRLVEVNPAVSIGHLSREQSVSFIPMSDVTESGQWIQRQERKLSEVTGHGYTAFQEQDILFAKITPCMENGKGAYATPLVNHIGFGTTEFHVLRARPGTDARFMYHWLQSPSLRRKAEALMTGSAGQRRVEARFFDVYHVPLFSLPEQRRIATILDTLDEQLQHTERLIAKLKHQKSGLLNDLLTRGIDEHGHLRDPLAHPEQFEDSPLGKIPKEWKVRTVKDICILSRGRVISQNELYAHPGIYPVYSSQSLNDGVFGYLSTFDFQGEYVTWTTDGAYAGAVFYRSGQFNCTNVCGMLRAKETNILELRYLAYALSTQTRKYVSYIGNPKLMNNTMGTIPIKVPPVYEQQAIADILDAHSTLIHDEETHLAKLQLYKQGLMHDLLTGRVRVGDDVTDIETLLEAH